MPLSWSLLASLERIKSARAIPMAVGESALHALPLRAIRLPRCRPFGTVVALRR
jgi:hypothetical protein